MVLESLKSRILPNGKLRLQLKFMKQIVIEKPNSVYARSVLKRLKQKFWLGAKKVKYSDFYNEAWAKFASNFHDGIFEIAGLKFINDGSLNYDFTSIFFSDEIQKFPVYSLNEEQEIAAKILSLISTSEGAYTTDKVFLKKDDIVIDAGANIGLFSLFASKQNVKQVYAFEPQKKVVEILKNNMMLNHSEDLIKIIPWGLSDKIQDLKLSHSKDNHSAASIIFQRNDNDESEKN